MKKITILFAAAVIIGSVTLISCKKKTTEVKGCTDPTALNYNKDANVNDNSCAFPQSDQKSVTWFVTGLWCHVCGEYGVPSWDKLYENKKSVMVPISLHSGDAFSCPAGDTLLNSTYLKGGGVPRMGEGLKMVFPSGVTQTVSYNVQKMEQAVNSTISLPMYAGTQISKTISGNTISITTRTKFTEAQTGTEYYLAVYLLEDGLVADQVTDHGTISMTHNNVLRAAVTPVWGTMVASGNVEAGKLIEKTYSRSIPSTWNASKLKVVTVLYYRDGSTSGVTGVVNTNVSE